MQMSVKDTAQIYAPQIEHVLEEVLEWLVQTSSITVPLFETDVKVDYFYFYFIILVFIK